MEPRNRAERRHPAPAEELWTVDQAASYLACTARNVREMVYRRRIPYLKVGRLVRFRRSELDAWLNQNRPVSA